MRSITPAEMMANILGDKANAARAAAPLGIEAQEMDGQQMLLASSVVPKDMRPDRAAFETLGFVFGAISEGIFLSATFPDGWKIVAKDDSYHSRIVDGQGRERASVFYKAAFYDRRADCRLLCRYGIRTENVGDDFRQYELVVWDNASQSAVKSFGVADSSDEGGLDPLREEATAWLDERYPESENPLAYW